MALKFETTKLPTCFVGSSYSVQLSAYGGTLPYTFSLVGTSLPTGLSLVGDTIQGTVTDKSLVLKSYALLIEVRDGGGVAITRPFSLFVRNGNLDTYEYVLDPALQGVIGPYQHENASHKIMAKIFGRIIGSADVDQLLRSLDVLVEGWTGLPPSTHSPSDLALSLVLEQLRTWVNYLGAPIFELITAGDVTPGPGADEVTVSITTTDPDIFVGTSAALYDTYFYVADSNDAPYIGAKGAYFCVKSVTPGAVVDGYTDTVSLVLGYAPNPDSLAPATPDYSIVWHSRFELRELPNGSFARFTRLLIGLIQSLKNQEITINGVGADSLKNIALLRGLGLSSYNQSGYNSLTLNGMSDGLVNGRLSRGVHHAVYGGSSVVPDGQRKQSIESTFLSVLNTNINPSIPLLSMNSTLSLSPSFDDIESTKYLRGGLGAPVISNKLTGHYFSDKITDAGLLGPVPGWLLYPPICRGDNEMSMFIRSRVPAPASDFSWLTLQMNWDGQQYFYGSPAADFSGNSLGVNWNLEDWYRHLESNFSSSQYYDGVINPLLLNASKPLSHLSPIPSVYTGSVLRLRMYVEATGVDVVLAAYTTDEPTWDASLNAPALAGGDTELGARYVISATGGPYDLGEGALTYEIGGMVVGRSAGGWAYIPPWDASTNIPLLADGVGALGDRYRVSVGGVVNLGRGDITFVAGDIVVYNNELEYWDKFSAEWLSLESYANVTLSDESGGLSNVIIIGPFPTVEYPVRVEPTYNGVDYVLNWSLVLLDTDAFNTALSNGPVIFYLQDDAGTYTDGVVGLPAMWWASKSDTLSLTSVAFASLLDSDHEFVRSGVSYYPGDLPAKFSISIGGYTDLDMLISDSLCLLSYVDGPKYFPVEVVSGVGTSTFLGETISCENFLGSCGVTQKFSIDVLDFDILRVYQSGALGLSESADSVVNTLYDCFTTEFPIYPTTTAQSHVSFLLNRSKAVSDELSEFFLDENYRLDASLFANYVNFVGPISPGFGTGNLYGWGSLDSLTDGHLQVCVDANPLVGASYNNSLYGLSAKSVDASMFVPCLKIPQDDYSTIRTSTPAHFRDPDYSGFVASEYIYDRVFVIETPTTILGQVILTGSYLDAPNRGLAVTDITSGLIVLEATIPGPVGSGWINLNASASSVAAFTPDGATSLGVIFEDIPLLNNMHDGNYQLVVRITIKDSVGALVGASVRITSLTINP